MRTIRLWVRWLLAGGLTSLLGGWQPAAAQTLAAGDSAVWATAQASYQAALGIETILYDGPEYVDYTTPGTVGHQFFLGPEVWQGTVTYRGGTFTNLPLRYDLAHDLVVLRLPDAPTFIELIADKVTGFSLGGHRFVRVAGDSLLPTGFYEVLADGPVRLLARHRKQSERAMVSQNLVQQYKQSDELLLRTPTTAGEVSNLKKLAAQLPNHREEVLTYARQQHLSFAAADRAASAERLLRYYYTLRP